MGTDARVLVTGFADLHAAHTSADAVRPALVGRTEMTLLGSHRALNPYALCLSVEAFATADGTALVEVGTGLRWKPDPFNHEGLTLFVTSCVRQLEGHELYFTSDAVTSELRYGDGILTDGLRNGTVQSVAPNPTPAALTEGNSA
jgi:hypothetical protein